MVLNEREKDLKRNFNRSFSSFAPRFKAILLVLFFSITQKKINSEQKKKKTRQS